MKEIWKMTFRIEKMAMFFLFGILMKFNMNQPNFWIAIFLVCLIIDRFEDSIRREYDDTTRDKLKRLIEKEMRG